jgi:hypothetical protein
VKVRKPAHPLFLFLGLGIFLATQIMAGTAIATCCDHSDRAGRPHPTQGSKCCPGAEDCPKSFHLIGCRIPVHALTRSGGAPEIMALAWKSAGNYCSVRDFLMARALLAPWKIYPQGIACRYSSSDPPIYIIDLTLII